MKGIAHITGGGFTDNIPRVFPEGLGALIYKDSWEVLPVFKWLQKVILLLLYLGKNANTPFNYGLIVNSPLNFQTWQTAPFKYSLVVNNLLNYQR